MIDASSATVLNRPWKIREIVAFFSDRTDNIQLVANRSDLLLHLTWIWSRAIVGVSSHRNSQRDVVSTRSINWWKKSWRVRERPWKREHIENQIVELNSNPPRGSLMSS